MRDHAIDLYRIGLADVDHEDTILSFKSVMEKLFKGLNQKESLDFQVVLEEIETDTFCRKSLRMCKEEDYNGALKWA